MPTPSLLWALGALAVKEKCLPDLGWEMVPPTQVLKAEISVTSVSERAMDCALINTTSVSEVAVVVSSFSIAFFGSFVKVIFCTFLSFELFELFVVWLICFVLFIFELLSFLKKIVFVEICESIRFYIKRRGRDVSRVADLFDMPYYNV